MPPSFEANLTLCLGVTHVSFFFISISVVGAQTTTHIFPRVYDNWFSNNQSIFLNMLTYIFLLPSTRIHEQGWCPYICVCAFVENKNLNRTLTIDSPFQTFAIGLLVEFID